jgi:hypothetical protein
MLLQAAAAAASLCWLAAGCHKEHLVPPEQQAVVYAPFTEADRPRIELSDLHFKHAVPKAKCADCHSTTDTSKLATDAASCTQCHAKSLPAKEVWRGHCLMCHDFKAPKTKGQMAPPKQEQCLLCHSAKQAGPELYGFYHSGSKMKFACSACHDPHAKKPIEPPQMCIACHGEMAATGLLKPGHVNCSACHAPHSWAFAAKLGCVTCHAKPTREVVHQVGAHPQDCTKCHSPHFSDDKLRGALCQTCHTNRVYLAGKNQPKQHLQCLNCHNQENWHFKGSPACASCHTSQGALLVNAAAPDKHKNCIACHAKHNFRTSFAATCKNCHKVSAVFEHQLPFHPQAQCSVCHDAHMATLPPKSGDCAGCHNDAIPSFAMPSPEPHTQCVNCHSQDSIDARKFEFVGPENSCQVCHPVAMADPEVPWDKAPSGHLLCNGCHPAHTWKVEAGPKTCGVCHSDVVEQATTAGMPECFNCHEQNHLAKFVGQDNSCAVCHAQQAGEIAGSAMADCSTCHQQHTFKADPASCTVCHTSLPGAHSASGHTDCLNCHALHTFKVDTAACTVCHTDRAEHFPGQPCLDCHSFSERGAEKK